MFGPGYPEGVGPFSHVTATDLARLVDEESHLGRGDLLVDVGCGRGGRGLHVAEHTGASLLRLRRRLRNAPGVHTLRELTGTEQVIPHLAGRTVRVEAH